MESLRKLLNLLSESPPAVSTLGPATSIGDRTSGRSYFSPPVYQSNLSPALLKDAATFSTKLLPISYGSNTSLACPNKPDIKLR